MFLIFFVFCFFVAIGVIRSLSLSIMSPPRLVLFLANRVIAFMMMEGEWEVSPLLPVLKEGKKSGAVIIVGTF